MVYAQDRRLIFLDITSSSGRIPSTRKSLIGCAQDGALTTTITTACWGCASAISASELPIVATVTHSAAPGETCSSCAGTSSTQSAAPGVQSAASGVQSAAPGAFGSAEAGAPWAPTCFFRVVIFAGCASFDFFKASRSVSEMKMDSDSGDGVMDGFRICSSDTPGGMDCLVEPSLDKASAASLFALGTWWNSHPSKYPLICCTRNR